MPGSTPNRGYPFPLGTEPPKGGSSDGPGNIEALGMAVDADVQMLIQALAAAIPPGFIGEYGGTTAPAGWLLCGGAAVSRTTYAALFAAIGVIHGVGDGSTTFNLPNLKGRLAVGLDASQAEFNTVGKTGGAKTHTLTVGEMPSHVHTWQRPRDGLPMYDAYVDNAIAGDAAWGMGPMNNAVGYKAVLAPQIPTGGGVAHNNLQPFIALNIIIKT